MTYKELIYELCSSTNFKNEEEAIRLAQYLANEAVMYLTALKRMEDKMKEVMTAKEYEEWAKEDAKIMFRQNVEAMQESDFKKFCTENFDLITSNELSEEEIEKGIEEREKED